MFPAGKKFFITLHKVDKSFLFASQDLAAHQDVIFQMTDCTIEVPIIELTDDLKEEERQKIESDEAICYSLTDKYYRTFYIYPNDTVLFNNNVTQGYKPTYLFLYWVDYTQESNQKFLKIPVFLWLNYFPFRELFLFVLAPQLLENLWLPFLSH